MSFPGRQPPTNDPNNIYGSNRSAYSTQQGRPGLDPTAPSFYPPQQLSHIRNPSGQMPGIQLPPSPFVPIIGYWVYGEPVPAPFPNNQYAHQQGQQLIGSTPEFAMGDPRSSAYPPVPEDAYNEPNPELYLPAPRLTFVHGPLPMGYPGEWQVRAPSQTPPRRPDHPDTQQPIPSQPSRPGQGQIHPPYQLPPIAFFPPRPDVSQAAQCNARAVTSTANNFSTWVGWPDQKTDAPGNLSCYQVCQQYPNSLKWGNLDTFLQHNWSAGEVAACLPQAIRNTLAANSNDDNPTWLTNRMVNRQNTLIGNSTWDATIYQPAQQNNYLRADGRPAGMNKFKSVRKPANAADITKDQVVRKGQPKPPRPPPKGPVDGTYEPSDDEDDE